MKPTGSWEEGRAASTGCGLGSRGLCQTSTKSCGRQGRLNSKVGPRSLTDVTGLADEQMLDMFHDLESSLLDGIKNLVGWPHTKATRGSGRTLGKAT